MILILERRNVTHYVKSVQIRSFFRSVFSRIWTEYGDLRSISPHSLRIRENTDQKKTPYLDTFHAVYCLKTGKKIILN